MDVLLEGRTRKLRSKDVRKPYSSFVQSSDSNYRDKMEENDYRLVTKHLKLTRLGFLHNRDPALVVVVRTTFFTPV
jgi:hypothetical protein